MTSWYSNLLTKTSSQISSLRSTLLASDGDGDSEDDTHVCRVLRNYYADKGRPLPPWLPADPKAAAAAPVPQPVYAQPQVGARYGGLAGTQQQQQGGGGLSSLWDNNAPAQQAPQQQQQQGLRAARPSVGGMRGGREDVLPRPLPSQRAGSYQSAAGGTPPQVQQPAGSSAQDRLRQRLWGGGSSRTGSPSQGGQAPFQPPSANSVGGGGGGAPNYDDRFAPGGTYDDGRGGGGGGRQGLPGGPRRQGLPSGPRGYR